MTFSPSARHRLRQPLHAIEITHEETGALNMVFQFEHMDIGGGRERLTPWKLSDLKQIMSRWQKDLENQGWNSVYLSNHDQPRPVSRFGNDSRYRVESAKMLATFAHLLQGTPYIYQGEEIGMTNVAFNTINDRLSRHRDTQLVSRGLWRKKEGEPQDALAVIHANSRDNARTPVQWDDSDQARFTSRTPWIKVNPNYPEINVKQALSDPNSVFYYYQTLIQLRKKHPIIVYGHIQSYSG